ncbi:AT-rich interactive domain-containing protein 6-like [Diospyros lotus]|uniref:AT-rich interactive domain-containing protein 6-like n=1 Tax=Diospyros lotus TaxID=55363 RepID=UPI002259BD24|nr:AT-rich interactive domain-containing protein 6-like [Diospyros lotus]XP_052191964.1 AT-rich interactive domain-containing protein 6-like [Diospyros lotus]
MTDYKTRDGKEPMKDLQDGVTNDTSMVDAAVAEEEQLSRPEETQLGSKDFPSSNVSQTGKESPEFDDAKNENKESPLPDHAQNLVATAKLSPIKDSNHPNVQSIEFPNEGIELQGLTEPSVVISAQAAIDARIGANVNELQVNSEEVDGTVELKNGLAAVELNPDIVTNEEELVIGESGIELPSGNDRKNKASNTEVSRAELSLENEIKEKEFSVGVTEIELPPDSGTKEGELDNVVTGTVVPLVNEIKGKLNHPSTGVELLPDNELKEEAPKPELDVGDPAVNKSSNKSFLLEPNVTGDDEPGTEEEQAAFMKELEIFHKDRCLEFKPPKFYGEPLNCLKLWRAVIRLGGYEQVTSCKLWRQVGESFKPPKTCTTVSWTFRCFYEKALLEYEKHKMRSGELPFTDASFAEPVSAGDPSGMQQASRSGTGRARRDAAARAMQGWHSHRLLGNEVGDPIIKDKNSTSTPKRERQLKNIGLLKRKKASPVERAVKAARLKASKSQSDTMVVEIGPPADWVKINVQRTKDCFEVYALVPGLLREEVRVQSDPAGRLVISGQPEQLDNPWGVTPFKKVVSLPSRIDPHQTSAVVTLHGQLFVRVPFEQPDL